jgi:hypothetical protein
MQNKKIRLTALTAAALLGSATGLFAQTSEEDRLNQLSQRVEALEAQAKAGHAAAPLAPVSSGWWNNTSISGRIYFDVTDIDHKSNGVKTPDNGVNLDLKRFYIGIDHTFNDMFAANITTDATYDSTTGTSQLFIKKAYLQMTLDPALSFRFGSADEPWIVYADGLYGNRFLERTLIDRTNYGTAADWGVHAMGSFFHGVLNYDIAAVNGATYRKIPSGGGTNRFSQLDLEGRVSLAYDGFNLAVGGYQGKLGQPYGTITHHTADRFDVLAAYVAPRFRMGVEYFSASNWTSVTKIPSDSAHGLSANASWVFAPPFGVFARYDDVTPNGRTVPLLKEHYYNGGLSWNAAKGVDFALTYKHEEAAHGTIATAAGTIGGSTNGAYNEVGIFAGAQF